MLQNRTISSSLSSTVPADWRLPVRRLLTREQWQTLRYTLRLPDGLRSFLYFLLAVLLICVGLVLHLQLSTTILQDQVRLEALQFEEQTVKEQTSNLVWAIVQETELNRIKVRATELGYEPLYQRQYVIVPHDVLATDPQQSIAQSGE